MEKITGLENVIYIGKSAFESCSKLKYIDTTNKLRYIDEEAFKGCYKL